MSTLELADSQSVPAWTPDSAHLVSSRAPLGVFVVEADGSAMWTLPANATLGSVFSVGNFSPAVSSDGSRVAYALVVGSGNSEIVTSKLDGSSFRRLTHRGGRDAYPAWSPDGSQIAFITDRSEKPGYYVYMMNRDGSNVRRLASVSATKHAPVWSPDGSYVAFVGIESVRTEQGNYRRRYTVHTVRPDGSDLVELGVTASRPAWSSDGTSLAFIRSEEERPGLYTMDADGSDQRLLWSFEPDDRLFYDNISWSPDGSAILIGTDDSGGPNREPHVFVVTVNESESGAAAVVTEVSGAASWSPGGLRLAVHDLSHDSDIVLYTASRSGSGVFPLVRENDNRLVAENSGWRNLSDETE